MCKCCLYLTSFEKITWCHDISSFICEALFLKQIKYLSDDSWYWQIKLPRDWADSPMGRSQSLFFISNWFLASKREIWKEWVPKLNIKTVRWRQKMISWLMHWKSLITISILFSFFLFYFIDCRCLKVQMTLGPKNYTTHIWTNVHSSKSPVCQTKLSSSNILLIK